MRVEVLAKIHPSEDPKKVREAVNNIFPELTLEVSEDWVRGESTSRRSLEKFKDKLGLQAIRDSARREFRKGLNEDSLHFSLNKQAATVDRISFSDGSTPLGPIRVTIEAEGIEDLVDYLAPPRKDRKNR